MSRTALLKTFIVVAVIVAATVILYPKVSDSLKSSPNKKDTNTVEDQSTQGEKALALSRKNGKPTMLLFHSTRCVPCKEISVIVADVFPQFKDRANLVDIVTDSSNEGGLIDEYSVSTIPTSVFFDSKGQQTNRIVGVIQKDELIRILESLEE